MILVALGAVIHFVCNMPLWTELILTYFWKGQEQATEKADCRIYIQPKLPPSIHLSIWNLHRRRKEGSHWSIMGSQLACSPILSSLARIQRTMQ